MNPSAPQPLLEVHGLAKVFPRATRSAGLRALGRLLWSGRSLAPGEGFVALEGIDFTVARGESFALVGENGAGKSTLLKLIAGVLQPSAGWIKRHGTVGALLELGAGFHADYTGRDNLKLAAALQGLTGAAFEAKLPEIIAFADIGEAIDEPVKHYSSGMVVRLGFALVTALRPDLLITDEVLAVGDESFQQKCIAWIERYLADGGTLLLVSHSLYHVRKLTQRALWLDHGRMRLVGSAHEVALAYQAFHEEKQARAKGLAVAQGAGPGGGSGAQTGGEPLTPYAVIELSIRDVGPDGARVSGRLWSRDGRQPQVSVGIVRADGTPVYGTTSEIAGVALAADGDNHWRFALTFTDWRLLPGGYRLRAHALDPEGLRLFDTVEREFMLGGATRELGFVRLPHQWEGHRER
ncbi:MAG: polysaccharide ABC transporter ATP-binding protein [Casimicrobiaceae bacterium]